MNDLIEAGETVGLKGCESPATKEKDGKPVPALALAEIATALDGDKCRKWLFGLLRPGRAAEVCPFCGVALGARMQQTFQRLKKTRCSACGRQFHATSGTIFHRSQLTPSEILLLAALIELGVEPPGIALVIRRGVDTVRTWVDRLRQLSPPGDLSGAPGEGPDLEDAP